MAADLTGVRRKLARAKNKLDTLGDEVAAYLDPPPFRLVVEANGNHQGIVCRIDREADDGWADELAEIAYQARSVLDLLIPKLIIDSGNPPRKGTMFPIYVKRGDYLNKGKKGSNRDRLLDGVASRHRSVIDEVQPWRSGRRAHRDPLAVLSTISNRDKHNDVYVCVAAIGDPAFKMVRPSLAPPDREITIRMGEQFTPYPMTDGAEFMGMDWTPPPSAPPNAVNTQIYLETIDMQTTLGFHSDNCTFTLDDIIGSVAAVSRIVDRCAARFKP